MPRHHLGYWVAALSGLSSLNPPETQTLNFKSPKLRRDSNCDGLKLTLADDLKPGGECPQYPTVHELRVHRLGFRV